MNRQLQLLADLTANSIFVHFCDRPDIDEIAQHLTERAIAVLPINGSGIRSRDDLFRAFAAALKKPKGWYGEEEYAPNVDAFLEYLDDVESWVPAGGHVVVVFDAVSLWRDQPHLAGLLVECWLFATGSREAKIHLVFAW